MMAEHNINVTSGSSIRLKTAGKYCDRDIIVTALNADTEEQSKLAKIIDRTITEITTQDLANITKIGRAAFEGCTYLTKINIPNNITYIGDYAFSNCHGLESNANIIIPNTITQLGVGVFTNCAKLKSLSLPDSITKIGDEAFYNCTSLIDISLPSNISWIGYRMFSGCKVLSGITLPSNITAIGEQAFYGCKALTQMNFPNGVTTIRSSAFANCTSMQYYDFSFHTSIPTLANTSAFLNIPSNCKIRVPYELVDDWKAATNWSVYRDYIVGMITFYIEGNDMQKESYFAESGMTWQEWIDSISSNDDAEYVVQNDYIIENSTGRYVLLNEYTAVKPSDVIRINHSYIVSDSLPISTSIFYIEDNLTGDEFYRFEEGMTWQDWVNSEYGTYYIIQDGFVVEEGSQVAVYCNDGSKPVFPSSLIMANYTYTIGDIPAGTTSPMRIELLAAENTKTVNIDS